MKSLCAPTGDPEPAMGHPSGRIHRTTYGSLTSTIRLNGVTG
jgi:hypothetical protein